MAPAVPGARRGGRDQPPAGPGAVEVDGAGARPGAGRRALLAAGRDYALVLPAPRRPPRCEQGDRPAYLARGGSAHRLARYMASNDPDFETKATNIIGLYLDPPRHAAVFCVDEKAAIQAFDRRDRVLPLSPGRGQSSRIRVQAARYAVALRGVKCADREVQGKTRARHTSRDFVGFLGDVVSTREPDEEINVILDNLSAHKTKLSKVERAYRCFKSVDLKVRPLHHRRADRVRAHVLLCMLAYYVEWHMRRALAPLLFDDHDPAAAEQQRTSVVAPARRAGQGPPQTHRKRPAGAQLPHTAHRPRDAGLEHDAGRRGRRHLHAADQAHSAAAALLRTLGGDAANVATIDNPKNPAATSD